MNRLPTALAMALLAGCGAPSSPEPTVVRNIFHVAPGGSDQAEGTQEQPWASLVHAAGQVKIGQHVIVHGGDYRLDAPIVIDDRGGPNMWIHLQAAQDETPVIDGSALSGAAVRIEGSSNVLVQGLTIRGAITVRDSHHVSLRQNTVTGVDVRGSKHIEVLRNDVSGAGIVLAGVENFEVASNRVSDGAGIRVAESSSSGKAHRNLVRDVTGAGLDLEASQDLTLERNRVRDCKGAAVLIGTGAKDVTVEHNTLHHNDRGLELGAGAEGVVVRDNIVSDNAVFQIGVAEAYVSAGLEVAAALAAQSIDITHNVVFPAEPAGEAHGIHATPGEDALTVVPGFVDPAGSKLDLRPDSPAQGYGAN